MSEGEWRPQHAPASVIETGDLRLRWWEPADVEALWAVVHGSLEHLRPWLPWVEGYERASAEDYVRRAMEGTGHGRFTYAMDDVGSGELLGSCALRNRAGAHTLEIAYWVREDRTREGIATRAAAALTRAAFALHDVDRVEIHHDAGNHASAGVPRRLGFTRVGEEARQRRAPAHTGPAVVWSITREAAAQLDQ